MQQAPSEAVEQYKDLRIQRYERGAVPLAKVWRGKAENPTWHYRFSSPENRETWIATMKQLADQRVAEAEKRKAERAEHRANFRAADHVKVGDVFCHSWGYDQTNIEFFQVVEVLPKSVKVREIAKQQIGGGGSAMSATVKPCPGQFLAKTYNFTGGRSGDKDGPLTAQVYVHGDRVYLKCQFGCCSRCAPDSTHYESWYA